MFNTFEELIDRATQEKWTLERTMLALDLLPESERSRPAVKLVIALRDTSDEALMAVILRAVQSPSRF
jgi:hypothetical protein